MTQWQGVGGAEKRKEVSRIIQELQVLLNDLARMVITK